MELMLDPNAKHIFWYLFAGSRGGNNRIKIIELLKEHPHNINQLAETLKLDYKAIQHHISVLVSVCVHGSSIILVLATDADGETIRFFTQLRNIF